MPIQIGYLVGIVSPPSLTVTLARVATDQQVGRGEFGYSRNVVPINDVWRCDGFVEITSRFAAVVRPCDCDSCFPQTQIASAAPRKKRYGLQLQTGLSRFRGQKGSRYTVINDICSDCGTTLPALLHSRAGSAIRWIGVSRSATYRYGSIDSRKVTHHGGF